MKPTSVAALAGRRIDAADAQSVHFPLSNVSVVRQALVSIFLDKHVALLIASAACGADLIALDAALESGLRCRVVLPFEPDKFRETSVVDRPGEWGPIYDKAI